MDLLQHIQTEVAKAAVALFVPAPLFILLGMMAKGRRLLYDMLRAARQTRTNILIHFTDAILVAPLIVLIVVGLRQVFDEYGLSVVPTSWWDGLHPALVGFAGVFLADFIGYWRHRLEHHPLLWPSHAVHHSDDEMTWLAIFRFHPINRLTTAVIDFCFLLLMGVPAYGVLAAVTAKHYYGAFVHADLPWTYGPLGYVFVSPAMHRWHHARDRAAYNTNFATVFSIFDLAFGTFRVPGPCNAPLGVPERMDAGFLGQMAHPFKPSSYRYFMRRLTRRA